MRKFIPNPQALFTVVSVSIALCSLAVPLSVSGLAQAPANLAPADDSNGHSSNSSQTKNPVLTAGAFSLPTTAGEFKEDQLKQLLIGKTLYLRDGYQENSLEFDEFGRLTGHSTQGSFTLSQIQINKLKLSKHKLELQGDRYGLHFLGAAAYEDPTKATDRVKITPKKKSVRISFLREQVEKPKKEKKLKHKANSVDQPEIEETADSTPQTVDPKPKILEHPRAESDKGPAKTTSPTHASQLLLTALDHVFSIGIDERMIAAMPDFWRLYYQATAAKADTRPTDPVVLHQNAVDLKAKLVSAIDPPSNEYAQANGIAGMALYHALIGSDGKVQQVIVGRPIGFGLDENAERIIRVASFQPALKEGKPVPVRLDLIVSFRIYSKRTSQFTTRQADDKPASLPGPYTLKFLNAETQQPEAASQQAQPATPQ
jgi:outer membrane biosynthesis protein TonB